MREDVVARKYGMVLDHNLFVEYWKYRRGEGCNEALVRKIMTYYHNEFLTNVGQFEHNKVQITRRLKNELAQNGFINQNLQELAALTTFKIILTDGQTNFPYVNINDNKFKPVIAAFYKGDEQRKAAADYLKTLCQGAKKSIMLYDKYLKTIPHLEDLLRSFIPNKQIQLIVPFDKVDEACRRDLKATHDKLSFVDLGAVPPHHDRYLIVDESVEVVLTSGFEYLQNQRKEITLVVRLVDDLHGLR